MVHVYPLGITLANPKSTILMYPFIAPKRGDGGPPWWSDVRVKIKPVCVFTPQKRKNKNGVATAWSTLCARVCRRLPGRPQVPVCPKLARYLPLDIPHDKHGRRRGHDSGLGSRAGYEQ